MINLTFRKNGFLEIWTINIHKYGFLEIRTNGKQHSDK